MQNEPHTDWQVIFDSLYPVNEELSEFDPGGWIWWKEVQPEIKRFISALLTTEHNRHAMLMAGLEAQIEQKAVIRASELVDKDLDTVDEAFYEEYCTINRVYAKLRAKVQEMKEGKC